MTDKEPPTIEVPSTALVEIPHAGAVNVAVQVAQRLKKTLSAKTPNEYRRKRKGPGGKMLSYAPWGYTARVLNQAFGPAWSMTFDPAKDVKIINLPPLPATKATRDKPGRALPVEREEVVVTCTLETPFGKQTATGSHTYFPSNPEIGYGDVIQSACSQALKRAAARLGVALDLYLDDGDDILPDPEDPQVSLWTAALEKYGLTEKSAIAMLSEKVADDASALRTVADIQEAIEGESAADVVELLEAVIEEMTQESDPPKKAPARRKSAPRG